MDFNLLFSIFLAFVSSIIPAIIWLLFWTTEDRKNPEPKVMIALAFIGGIIAVFVSLFLEKYLYGLGLKDLFTVSIFGNVLYWFEFISKNTGVVLDKVLLVVIFAPVIEELAKFLMAYILVLRSKADDEPLDPMIYMIATALGFAAIENMLFLIAPFDKRDYILTIFTGNMRFIGATLLHTISSATIALFISFHFFIVSKVKKLFFTIIGIICAIFMHGVFNILMLGNEKSTILALELIWIIVIIILLAFEKIKQIKESKIL